MTTIPSVQQIAADHLADHAAVRSGLVLDVRPQACFVDGHVRGAFSWPLPPAAASWGEAELAATLDRDLPSIFLPARHEPLLVMASDAALARRVASLLQGRGRVGTDWAAWPDGDCWPPGLPRACDERQGRLWSPPAFLSRWWRLLPPPAAGPILDLACGSGRAAVWLAERGWRVTAIDHQPEALALGRRLAAAVGAAVDWREADLREPASLPSGPWAAVLMFRYLQRGLLPRLPEVLVPDGLVMMSTFRDAPGYVGNPQLRHRLRPAEATSFWPAGSSRILVHEEGFDSDGKPATGLVTRWTGRRP